MCQILFVFNLVNANIQALNFCSISLNSDLLRDVKDYNKFLDCFSNTVEKVSASPEVLKSTEKELVQKVCSVAKEIILQSIGTFK